jgi:hypothetical protein
LAEGRRAAAVALIVALVAGAMSIAAIATRVTGPSSGSAILNSGEAYRADAVAIGEPEGRGTRLSQTFRTQGFIPAIAARIFATGSWSGSFRGELEHFGRIPRGRGRAGGLGRTRRRSHVGRLAHESCWREPEFRR